MNVLFAASEAVPFSKTGGLADVAGSLPGALRDAGAKVSLFIPRYRSSGGINLSRTGYGGGIHAGGRVWEYNLFEDGAGAYLIDCPELFDRDELYGTGAGDYSDNPLRFSFFCRAVLESSAAMDISPDVLHANDWQTALIPLYMKTTYSDVFPDAASVLTIHNIGYQGLFSPSAIWDTGLPESLYNKGTLEFYGQLNFLKAGIIAADSVSTVSRTYAGEIMQPESGFGLEGILRGRADSLYGIVNGLNYTEWDPATDGLIPARYSISDMDGKAVSKRAFSREAGFDDIDRPLVGVVSRLAHQKGIDLVAAGGRDMVEMGLNVAVLGRGDPELEKSLTKLARELEGAFWVSLLHDERAAHEVYAASDMFIMPSRYEPCGLSQLIAMRYGTVPVARATGGIVDTVEDFSMSNGGTGFTFRGDDDTAMLKCLKRAVAVFGDRDLWSLLMSNAMRSEFSWDTSARKYIELYEKTLVRTRGN
jgi:starch synthase